PLGCCCRSHFPVADLILGKLPATLELAARGFAVALLIGLPLGTLAALRPESWLARAVGWYAGLGLAVASFWFGILLSLFIGLYLTWLPPSGYAPLWPEPAP